MIIKRMRTLSPDNFTPTDIILEWKNKGISIYQGALKAHDFKNSGNILDIESESIDKVIIDDTLNNEHDPERIIVEAKRVLHKNGRLFLSFYNFEDQKPFASWLNSLKVKYLMKQEIPFRWSLDYIANIIEKNDLLIDRNIVVKAHQPSLVYFEIIKLDNDILKKVSNL
ncbi:class I SAM-dependent methyltransferase [Fusibacter ferrireducens]|uniref:Methyltransferase domain-containing protein n=1 Tax=Fusibacter ferrireducens TaxID=2785058 RepID=A0ABR9ZXB7_9FIRM|nr:methyltransferase domain-containing protein [Fusibacter ferrireducens]MBF4694591.1 methyltransferase domain-containing protein [Fusibacter ferrireducens]